MVDPGHEVVVVVETPPAPGAPAEVLPVAGGGARVRVEHHVPLGGRQLAVEGEVVAVRAVGPSMHLEDHREVAPSLSVPARREHPALDLGAIGALEEEAFGLHEFQLRQQRAVHLAQAGLGRPGHGRDEDVTGLGGRGRAVGDAGEVRREGEAPQAPVAVGDLLDCATVRRHAEEVGVAPDARREVDVATVRRGGGAARDKVPLGGEVGPAAARGLEGEEVARGPPVPAFPDDHVQPLVAARHDLPAVRGPCRRGVAVLVVGEAGDGAVQVDGPEIGALIAVLVALVRVGGEGEAAPVRAPRQPLGVHSQLGDAARLSSGHGKHVDLAGRRGCRITRIGQVASPVEAVVHPVVGAAVEAVRRAAFKVRSVGGLRSGPRRGGPRERDPCAVRTEDRRPAQALDLESLARGPVHAQEPGAPGALAIGTGARGCKGEQAPVRRPARSRCAEARAGQAHRIFRACGVRKPDFAVAPVLLFEDRSDHERDPRPIGRDRGAAGILQPIVVLEFDEPGLLGGQSGRGRVDTGKAEGGYEQGSGEGGTMRNGAVSRNHDILRGVRDFRAIWKAGAGADRSASPLASTSSPFHVRSRA